MRREVCGIAKEIPLTTLVGGGIAGLRAGSTKVSAGVCDVPRCAGLNDGGSIDGPAFEHLSKALDTGNAVGPRDGQTMADVESAGSIELPAKVPVTIERNDVAAPSTLARIDGQSMSIGVARSERQPMEVTGGEDRLQAVVIGLIEVSIIVDESKIRVLAAVRPGVLLVRSADLAARGNCPRLWYRKYRI